ncbi:MAG: SDR family oxidoreductase [Vulcanimicrobiaceae bacterium]
MISTINQFREQRFLIFGGTSGIGLATARMALDAGASVAIAGRSPQRLSEALASLGRTDVQGFTADVSVEGDVAAVCAAVGTYNHLVMTAAHVVYELVADLEMSEARKMIDSKLLGALHAVKHSRGRIAPSGSITFVSGIAAYRPGPRGSVAAAVNGALASLSRAFAVELAPVRVNAVSPGWIDTPIWKDVAGDSTPAVHADMAARLPVKRIGKPNDIASAIAFLAHNEFVTGTVLHVDGGHRLV